MTLRRGNDPLFDEEIPKSRSYGSVSGKIPLPEGVRHGSIRAVRLGCACKACNERRHKARRRGAHFY